MKCKLLLSVSLCLLFSAITAQGIFPVKSGISAPLNFAVKVDAVDDHINTFVITVICSTFKQA